MSSVNKVILIGALGADPEVKSFQNGGRIANLRLATGEKWKDKTTGEQKEKTEWHSVTLSSDGLVGVAERFLKKGSKVYIEGKLQTRKWQDQSGTDKYSTEIVLQAFNGTLTMLDGPSGGESREAAPRADTADYGAVKSGAKAAPSYDDGPTGAVGNSHHAGWGAKAGMDIPDDEIPFVMEWR